MNAADLVAIVEGVATQAFGCLTLEVRTPDWQRTARALCEDERTSLDFFDWLSAYDDGESGLAVVARLWSTGLRHGVVIRTRVERDGGRLGTLSGIWVGAAWHERETAEMFGVGFDGHPDPRPLLLPDGFRGHPLRKEFVLAARVAKEWPGAKEPGESVPGRKRPLGMPAAGWSGP